MQPTRFQLEAGSLEELRERVRADYGPEARIVSAERVTVGGLGGFLSRRHIEAVVEVPAGTRRGGGHADADADPANLPERAVVAVDDTDGESTPRPRGRRAAEPHQPLPERTALVALLAEADVDEAHVNGRTEPGVSTESADFDRLMDDLTFGAQPSSGARAARVAVAPADQDVPTPARHRPVRPAPLHGAGDLVLVVGLGADAHRAAAALAGPGLPIHQSGASNVAPGAGSTATKALRIGDRIGRVEAQAAGVRTGEPVFIAYGLDHAVDLETQVQEVDVFAADQLWVCIDAGRKSEDTRAWVEAIDAVCPVDAVAVHGRSTTASPDTVLELGIPWREIDQPPHAGAR
ncbi:hypothetical protein [Arthrobacter sp. JSM 101049]|uniref:hypothetical protein n=1 Tax=Arthrobacter sp. JSM 101049 TaxID=929097 RepID=UPI003565B34A